MCIELYYATFLAPDDLHPETLKQLNKRRVSVEILWREYRAAREGFGKATWSRIAREWKLPRTCFRSDKRVGEILGFSQPKAYKHRRAAEKRLRELLGSLESTEKLSGRTS